jgi:hypothetical protein
VAESPALLAVACAAGRLCHFESTEELSVTVLPGATIGLMPTEHIVALLIQERDKLNRAIELLKGEKRRGRPPKIVVTAVPSENGHKKKRTFSPAQRKQQAARMKAYWAAKKKATK